MVHSTVTEKGQTTLPSAVRTALNIHPGDTLEYKIEKNKVTIQVHPGTRSLAGALASKKGKDLSFNEIRKIAQTNFKKSKSI